MKSQINVTIEIFVCILRCVECRFLIDAYEAMINARSFIINIKIYLYVITYIALIKCSKIAIITFNIICYDDACNYQIIGLQIIENDF